MAAVRRRPEDRGQESSLKFDAGVHRRMPPGCCGCRVRSTTSTTRRGRCELLQKYCTGVRYDFAMAFAKLMQTHANDTAIAGRGCRGVPSFTSHPDLGAGIYQDRPAVAIRADQGGLRLAAGSPRTGGKEFDSRSGIYDL